MIFAFATDERSIAVFHDEATAIGYCEGIDVFDGNWKFFDGFGKPLAPVFSEQPRRSWCLVSHGKYSLKESDVAAPTLSDILPLVTEVDGPEPLNTVEGIAKYLRSLPGETS